MLRVGSATKGSRWAGATAQSYSLHGRMVEDDFSWNNVNHPFLRKASGREDALSDAGGPDSTRGPGGSVAQKSIRLAKSVWTSRKENVESIK